MEIKPEVLPTQNTLPNNLHNPEAHCRKSSGKLYKTTCFLKKNYL